VAEREPNSHNIGAKQPCTPSERFQWPALNVHLFIGHIFAGINAVHNGGINA
jgi:hypothetical protein